ncbi:MAG: SAM-dependent chlorinase/fluorinase [Deltaproteobacteria bacterium]|nr:SAM-dependent chlorinase/fluorinase [Deltaproteobacteria bacterium]
MPDHRMITLLTDFGLKDPYVGIMKGVISRINPHVRIIDITHEIPPHNVEAANFCLMMAYPHFPAGTVHVAIVDPGVGGKRRALGMEFAAGIIVGPDNGIFTGILDREQIINAVELTNSEYWLTQRPGMTFHGRDIFAPVAAHLTMGTPLKALGPEIDPAMIVRLDRPVFPENAPVITGTVQYIDRFGNLITNIPAAYVGGKEWVITAAGVRIRGCHTYSDTPRGNLLALEGSHGFLEIAINGGNAQASLQVGYGLSVRVEITHSKKTDGKKEGDHE